MSEQHQENESQLSKSLRHFASGAIAGMCEHTGAFPIDTLKTHMQARNTTAAESYKNITSAGTIRGFFRGWTAVALGAAPAHAIYFTAYEFIKNMLGNNMFSYAVGGTVATFLNDAVITPMDAVKQRRQLNLKAYRGTWHCLTTVFRTEGLTALYAGFTTTLVMNVPFHSIYFNVYEFLRKTMKNNSKKLKINNTNTNNNNNNNSNDKDKEEFEAKLHVLAGAGAGMVAAGITNPLDVAKTRLQTRGDLGVHYKGMFGTVKTLWVKEGISGMTCGIFPRMLFHSLSAAILWTTYEFMKYSFGITIEDHHH